TVRFGKLPHTGFTVLKSVSSHEAALQSIQDMEEFVGVSAQQRPREYHDPATDGSEGPKRISLRRLAALQLVNFIRNSIVEECIQVTPDEFDRGHPMNLTIVGLPQWTEEGLSAFRRFGPDRLDDFDFPEVDAPNLVFATDHGTAGVGIHDGTLKA